MYFSTNSSDIADLTFDQLSGPAVVINIADKVQHDLNYQLSVHDIQSWEKTHGQIPVGAFVFMLTGWGQRWPEKALIFNADDLQNITQMRFPGFHPEATEHLISQRNIRGVGSDGPSTDSAPELNRLFGTHVALAKANLIGIEFAAYLEKLPAIGAQIILAPMKNDRGSGAPTRLLGILP